MLNYVIFDMDGVLIDSEPMHARAAVNAMAGYGVTIDLPYCYRFIGSTTRFMVETMIHEFHLNITANELLATIEAEKIRLTEKEGYIEIPGISSLIANLYKHNVKLAVASSSNPDEIEKAIIALGLKPFFSKLISSCTVACPKPAPDVFLKAVEELNANIEECLIIEDSSNGLLAAKAAGIPAIGFANPNSGKQDLSSACLIVEGFEEIDYQFLSNLYCRIYNLPIIIAETKRLQIRELMPEDMQEVYMIYQDKETIMYTDILPSDSLETEKEKQKAYVKNIYHFYGYGIWGIFEHSSGKCIGRCGIESKIIDGQAELELSYLLDKHYWGQGYALECVYAVIHYAKEQLHAQRLVAIIDKQNIRSVRLAERLGFLIEKDLILKNHSFYLYALELSSIKDT